MRTNEKIKVFYDAMLAAYGPQGWWPAGSAFEMIVGAILTQNTNWKNVERAIANLKRENLLNPAALEAVPVDRLAEVIQDIFPLKPAEIIDYLDLRRPIYTETAHDGHFGRIGRNFTWERTDKAAELRKAFGL